MSSSLPAARFPAVPLAGREEETDTANACTGATTPEVSDEALIARVCSGDGEALTPLFQRYARLVRSIALHILRDGAEAEDLAQDLFLFIQRKCAVFDSSKSSARSWIVHMAYQRAIERRRYLGARQFYTHTDLQGTPDQPVGTPTTENDYSAEAVFGRNGLKKVIEALSEDQRETLRLHFFEGYTLAEISEKLEQPLGNVRHYYYRGLDRLRREMFGSKVRVVEQHGE
jgi:RNA polymerase sigma-70 factor, ECF subfamily